jgi:hypothetical protein
MSVAEKRRFYLVDADGVPTVGRLGYINAISGLGEYLDIGPQGLVIEDPGALDSQDFRTMLESPNSAHPLTDKPKGKA